MKSGTRLKRARIVVPVLVVLFFLLSDFGLLRWTELNRSHWTMMILGWGIFMGQVNLIAIWTAMVHGSVVVRLPIAFLMTVVLWCVVLASLPTRPWETVQVAAFLAVAIPLGVAILLVPLGIAARGFGWRIVGWWCDESWSSESRSQFNLKQVSLGVLLFSVALALVRAFMPKGSFDFDPFFIASIIYPVGIFALISMLVALPCIWGAFTADTRWEHFVGWIGCLVLLSIVYMLVARALSGSRDLDPLKVLEAVVGFGLMLLSLSVTVYGTLRIARSLGCRLCRAHREREG